jgi:hypothetical protein
MKTCVIVASHIYYDNQLYYLNRCLISLLNQVNIANKPKIYVSISFSEEKYFTEFKNIILANNLFNTVFFNICDKQKYQMEHIFILTKFINDYDLVFFCDDDDTYHPMRMSIMINCYQIELNYNKNINGVRDIFIEEAHIDKTEFWAYGIKPYILNQFFNNFKNDMDLLQNIFADMFLREYLKNNKKINQYAILKVDVRLYNYTQNNTNSVCSTLRKGDIFKRLRNQMLLYAIADRELHSNLNTTYMRENLLKIENIINKLEKILNEDNIENIITLYADLNDRIEENKQLLIHLNSFIYKDHPDNYKLINIKNNIDELKYNIPQLHNIINELETIVNPEMERIRTFNIELYNKKIEIL